MIGLLVKDEIKRAGMTQTGVANCIGIARHHLNDKLNGRQRLDKDTLNSIADVTGSTLVRMLARGTTTDTILFRNVQLQFLATLTKAKEGYRQAIEAIDDVLLECVNLKDMEQADEKQKQAIYHMLGQVCDANIASDCVDLVCADLGADIERRNRENEAKYRERGYDPWVLSREELKQEAV